MVATFWRLGIAALLFVAFVPQNALSGAPLQDQRIVDWANAALRKTDGPIIHPVRTEVSDHFGPVPYSSPNWWRFALANGGRKIETACSGSFWVYDPVHHIVAVSEGGGDAIFYSPKPPFRLPARDLLKVASIRGLRLGISPSRAAQILGVSSGAVKRASADESVLYARKDRICGKYSCAHDATVIFRNDKAVSIALDDIGP